MADVIVYLQGGPCDGTNHILTAAEGDEGVVACKGGMYRVTSPVRVHNGDAIYAYAGKVPKPQPGGLGNDAAVMHGWSDVRRSINRHMPAALHSSQRSRKAALRILSHASKVRL